MPATIDNSLNIGRDDISQPAMFVYAPCAPERSDDAQGYQCRFGARNYAVQQYITCGWMQAEVYRDSEKSTAEVRLNLHHSEGGNSTTRLNLSADDLQKLAEALMDAAHHLRTVPAAPYVWAAHAKAEAVPA